MLLRPRLRAVATATSVVALTVGLAGCGSGDEHGRPDVPTVAPATALSAAPTTSTPDGTVIAAPGLGTALALAPSGALAVIARDGRSVSVRHSADLNRAPLVVPTPQLRAITADGDGFVGVGPDAVVRISATGQKTQAPLTRPALAVATDGPRVLVGTEHGHLLVLDAALKQTHDIGGLVRVDAVAVAVREGKKQIVVLDRAQSLVTTVDPDSGDRGAALRAGNGATTLIGDRFGRFLVANPRDGQIIGFYGDPLIMRFRYPVADGPYGLAYDSRRDVLWVSLTAVNRVVGYKLSTGQPREIARFNSVRQPDSIVVDQESGAVYALSAVGEGLQRVDR